MRTIKKLLCMLIALVALLAICGCGSDKGETNEPIPEEGYAYRDGVYRVYNFKGLETLMTNSLEVREKKRDICIMQDITVLKSLSLLPSTEYTLWANKDVTVTLGTQVTDGAMFQIVGQTAVGGITLTLGKGSSDGGTITFDGNKEEFNSKGIVRNVPALVNNSGANTEISKVNLIINKAVIQNCRAEDVNGSAIYLSNYSRITVTDVIYRNNETTGNAKNGTIYCAEAVVYGGEFYDNAHSGSSAAVFYVKNGSQKYRTSAEIYGGYFHDNFASNEQKGTGGALSVGYYSSTHIYGGTFERNGAKNGGAVYTQSEDVIIDGAPKFDGEKQINQPLVFFGNIATGAGGAVYVTNIKERSEATLAHFSATGNYGEDIYISDSQRTFVTADEVTADVFAYSFKQQASEIQLLSDFPKSVLIKILAAYDGDYIGLSAEGEQTFSNIRLEPLELSSGKTYGLTSDCKLREIEIAANAETHAITADGARVTYYVASGGKWGEVISFTLSVEEGYFISRVFIDGTIYRPDKDGVYRFAMRPRDVKISAVAEPILESGSGK